MLIVHVLIHHKLTTNILYQFNDQTLQNYFNECLVYDCVKYDNLFKYIFCFMETLRIKPKHIYWMQIHSIYYTHIAI